MWMRKERMFGKSRNLKVAKASARVNVKASTSVLVSRNLVAKSRSLKVAKASVRVNVNTMKSN